MNFEKYVTEIEAFQWFPGMETPWKIREMVGPNRIVYYVLDRGEKHDYGTYGPMNIEPGDYIVKNGAKFYHTSKEDFEKKYTKDSLEYLKHRDIELLCLEHAGVDNWEGCSYASKLRREMLGNEDDED